MKRKGKWWSGEPGSETRSQRKQAANMAKRPPALTREEEAKKRREVHRKRYGPPTPVNVWYLITVSQREGYGPYYSVGLSAPSKKKAAILRARERSYENQEYGSWGGYYWDDNHRICVRKQEAGESYLTFIQRFEMELYGEIRTRSIRRR